MLELSTASAAKAYFNDIIAKMEGVKIKSVFSPSPFFNSHLGYREYEDDTPIYIVFENGQCLIIEYRFIDTLCVDFRPLNEEEEATLEKQLIKDYFNCSVDIHSWDKNDNGESVVGDMDRTETISLEYDTLVDTELRQVTEEYSKWIDGDIDSVSPTNETFDQIKFILGNGNTFVVCADDAEVDGYIMAWSTDAKESTIRYK